MTISNEQYQDILNGFKSINGIVEVQNARMKDFETKAGRPALYGASSSESIGAQFVKSDAFKRYVQSGQSVSDLVNMSRKDLLSSLSSRTGYQPDIVSTAGGMPLTIRDLIPSRPVDAGSVTYMVHTATTNNAAFVPEKALKPESTMTLEEKTAQVLTLAHWVTVSNQALADLNGVQALIDNELVAGLRGVEELALLFGSGTTGNLQGIMNAGIEEGEVTTGATIDRIRRAITQVAMNGGNPNGIVLHPYTWEEIELSKDLEGRYLMIEASTGATQRLFRVPVVVTPAMTEPSFLVGDFGGATIFDREQIGIQVSEHHQDYFTKNLRAIRAESRLAFAVRRPNVFVKGTTI
ncbi:phage major capsid protein [Paenibacillus albus]|uniref:Phage major capsid protein n=1 Tax=Paenibacillus albus TaxID=2495582 RepID=A0A3S9A408_9BACL|nr:phage major capsid protein [Paenibacillus albus]AZN40453.1 phage major capsid protein [Paenibacillus albus]